MFFFNNSVSLYLHKMRLLYQPKKEGCTCVSDLIWQSQGIEHCTFQEDCNSNPFWLLADIISSVVGLAVTGFLLNLGFCSGNASRQRYATEELYRIQALCFQQPKCRHFLSQTLKCLEYFSYLSHKRIQCPALGFGRNTESFSVLFIMCMVKMSSPNIHSTILFQQFELYLKYYINVFHIANIQRQHIPYRLVVVGDVAVLNGFICCWWLYNENKVCSMDLQIHFGKCGFLALKYYFYVKCRLGFLTTP